MTKLNKVTASFHFPVCGEAPTPPGHLHGNIFTLLGAPLFNIYVQHYGGVAHTAAHPQCHPSDHQTSTMAPPVCRQFPVTFPRSEMVNGLSKGGGDTDPDDSCYQSEGYFSAFHIDAIILKNTLTLSEHSTGR